MKNGKTQKVYFGFQPCNYIGIGITKNTKHCNVILITIPLFSDNTIIEP